MFLLFLDRIRKQIRKILNYTQSISGPATENQKTLTR